MGDDICWSCHEKKNNVNGTKGEYHSGICQDCIDEQAAKLKQAGAELIQTDRQPNFSGWYNKDVIIRDVAVKVNGVTYKILGFHTCDPTHNTCKAFKQVKQFIETNFKYHVLYGKLDMLKEYDFWFYVQKVWKFYEFCGNCNECSNAFSLRTTDINQIWEYIQVWTVLPDKLKQQIKAKVDKKFVFSSAPEPHSAEKAFCVEDYSDWEETKKPKIIPITGYTSRVLEKKEVTQ